MISFANAQDSADIRITCSKVLFLINFFDRRFYENLKKILMVTEKATDVSFL